MPVHWRVILVYFNNGLILPIYMKPRPQKSIVYNYLFFWCTTQVNIVKTRSLGSNKSNLAISESGENRSYNIKSYHSGHICIFLRRITIIIIDYWYYSLIKIPVIKITDKTKGEQLLIVLQNKTNVCVYSNRCVMSTLGRTLSLSLSPHHPSRHGTLN